MVTELKDRPMTEADVFKGIEIRKEKGIVISGPPVSGKSVLARMLSQELGIPVWSVGKQWRKMYEEKYPQRDITFEQFWGGVSAEDNKKMDQEVKTVFESGKVIGDGRYAALIVDKEKCWRIFITAPFEIRADRAAKRPDYAGTDIKEVKRLLAQRENDEVRIGEENYGVDYRDNNLYDLCIRSDQMLPKDEVAAVMRLIQAARG